MNVTRPGPTGRIHRLLPVLAAALLGGCGGLFQSNERPEQTYYLRAPAAATTATAAAVPGATLRLARLLAGPGLDSPRIVLLQPDRRMDFFAASRWPTPVPDMLEALALQTLRDSHHWQVVEGSGSAFPGLYLLQISIRRFEADYDTVGGPPQVHVVLDCVLGRRDEREAVASFVASGSAQAGANRMREVVAAFEQATGQALNSLALQAAGAAPGP